MKKLMLIEWKGSSFEPDRTPRPQYMVSAGFFVDEDEISITIASHYRVEVTEDEKPIGYAREHFKTCIRKSQIVRERTVLVHEVDHDDR